MIGFSEPLGSRRVNKTSGAITGRASVTASKTTNAFAHFVAKIVPAILGVFFGEGFDLGEFIVLAWLTIRSTEDLIRNNRFGDGTGATAEAQKVFEEGVLWAIVGFNDELVVLDSQAARFFSGGEFFELGGVDDALAGDG